MQTQWENKQTHLRQETFVTGLIELENTSDPLKGAYIFSVTKTTTKSAFRLKAREQLRDPKSDAMMPDTCSFFLLLK